MAQKILILGAGELGTAIVDALLDHSAYSSTNSPLTISVRGGTLSKLKSDHIEDDRIESLRSLQKKGVSFVAADLVEDGEEELISLFNNYNIIIHAGAMTLPPGTQLKVTKAVLDSSASEYVPWQWGVDYDIIGPESGHGVFSEQCNVRELLRAQTETKWFILSCGIFMSFLFEKFWGVVQQDDKGDITGVRALGGWDHLITASTVEDIARCNAELILVDKDERGKAVYMASDSMTYTDFATMIEKVVGRNIDRNLWTTGELIAKSLDEQDDKLWQYRAVFSEDRGLAWSVKGTYNDVRGLRKDDIASYVTSRYGSNGGKD